MKYVSRSFIKDLLFRTDIVKLISSKINLCKVGNRYKCYCPFHKENNASFIVDKEKKFFYCFGCKIYGNSIDFLMKFNNINFLESIIELSKFNGVELILNKNKDINKFNKIKKKYFKLMLILTKIYHKFLLFNININLIKKFFLYRNINLDMIKKFFLGFSNFNLLKYLIKFFDKKELEFLIKFNILFKDKQGNIYDRFYNRIIFPIFDLYGRVIAFSGRSLVNNNIKYINSSKNIFFSKKNCLYGLNYIKKKTRLNKIFIVEGYIDVISLHKFNFLNTVGLLGSSINLEQIKILYFYTDVLFFCFDGDNTGFSAIKKTLKLLLFFINEKRKSYFIFLPKGEDPDSILRKNDKNKFNKYIKNAKSILDVLFDIYLFKKNFMMYEERFIYIKKILFLINRINSPIIKWFLNRKLCLKIGLENSYLDNLKNLKFKRIKFKNNKYILIIRYLISLLLKNLFLSKLVNIYDKIFYFSKISNLGLFLNIISLCVLNKIYTFNKILEKFSRNFLRFYLEYLFLKNYFSNNINDKLYFLNFLKKLKNFLIDRKLNLIFKKGFLSDFSLKKKKKIWYLIKLKNFFK